MRFKGLSSKRGEPEIKKKQSVLSHSLSGRAVIGVMLVIPEISTPTHRIKQTKPIS